MGNALSKAVILARGLGTRMRKADPDAALDAEQRKVAATGLKAMISVGRPFLDYVLTALADAHYTSVCLVIGPEHEQIRTYYTKTTPPQRVTIEFAIQAEPRGTADAVAAARDFAGEDDFLVINSDNYYPVEALRLAHDIPGMGLIAYEREALLRGSNIPPERVNAFAVVEMNERGCMTNVVEKPDATYVATLKPPVWISMNSWRFGPKIFAGCESIAPSARGELELVDAVRWCMKDQPCAFKTARLSAPVLDLSYQSDIQSVKQMLAGVQVSF